MQIPQEVKEKMINMVDEKYRKHLTWSENDGNWYAEYINKHGNIIVVSKEKNRNKYHIFPLT